MSDNESQNSHGAPPDVAFRANKRRKIIRRRNVDESDESSSGVAQAPRDISEQESSFTLPTVRRPHSRKHGIAFSSVAGQQSTETPLSGETSVVPSQKQDDEPASNDRFTKPTGKTEVVEDKHLTAYVDSKLAELRSTSSMPPPTRQDHPVNTTQVTLPSTSPKQPQITPEASVNSVLPIHQPRKNTRRATNRPSRGQRPKDANELAREAMIEQILGESQVPMYDQSSSSTARVVSSDDTGIDNDEAAAEAFKADFLASLELQNRRRPAASSAAAKNAVKGAAPVPSGPKLGGSRAQREKMRAIEEAKHAGGAPPKR